MIETKGFWMPRVIIAEDSKRMARTISRMVQLHCDIIAVVRDGQGAIDAVLELQPNLLLIDVLMPVLDGIQVVRRLRALNSQCRVVILTGLEDQEYIDAAMAAGANAFVFERRMASDLLRAIGEVTTGRAFVSRVATSGAGKNQ